MLFTTEEISEMFSSKKNKITPYMITHTWIPNGLKYIKGRKNSYLYKKEWVEEYLDEQAYAIRRSTKKTRRPSLRKLPRNCNLKVV